MALSSQQLLTAYLPSLRGSEAKVGSFGSDYSSLPVRSLPEYVLYRKLINIQPTF